MQESIHQFGCGFAIVLFFVYIRSRCFVLFICTYMSYMLMKMPKQMFSHLHF